MRQTIVALIVAVVGSIGAAACDSTSLPSGPGGGGVPLPPDSFVGAWSGNLNDKDKGTGTLAFTLELRTFDAGGSWQTTIGGQTIGGSAFAVRGNPPGGGEPVNTIAGFCSDGGQIVFGVKFAPERMTGTYLGLRCPGLSSGTFDVAKGTSR